MEKIEFRANIKIRVKLGISAKTITDELLLANGNQVPNYSTDGRECLDDYPR